MFAELLHTDHLLRGWKRRPDAPIIELSLGYSEERTRPFTPEEVEEMKAFLRLHAPTRYRKLFATDEAA